MTMIAESPSGVPDVPPVAADRAPSEVFGLSDLSPEKLRRLCPAELAKLAEQIRTFLVDSVTRTGGHLGPNLGVVELTIALHRTFDSPRTPIVFDTGHQSYVHKLITGRADGFSSLRRRDGMSGYPSREESPHDQIENSHASTALAYADGLSRSFALAGDVRPVVAVIGDGALTGGLAWESLNNLAVADRPVVVVLNDNGRSYAPTVGGLPRHLRRLSERSSRRDLVTLLGGEPAGPTSGEPANLFRALGLRYLGPVDGHDLAELEPVLSEAAASDRPVVVHVLTRKGKGYAKAEAELADHLHTVPGTAVVPPSSKAPLTLATQPGFSPPSVGKPGVGKPGVDKPGVGKPGIGAPVSRPNWTEVFGTRLVELAREQPQIVAITAAMTEPTGLGPMAAAFPERTIDVGIAEQQAVGSAAGLALGGRHPVVALYATFANRAFDQILLDVGLHNLPVTFVLDRAGVTGPDGPSHHGIWDLAAFALVPGMRVAAPRDGEQLAHLLTEAVASSGPTMLRYPKGRVGEPIRPVGRWGDLDVLRRGTTSEVLIVGVGAMVRTALAAAEILGRKGIEATVVDPRWVLPVPTDLIGPAGRHRLVVTVEDGVRQSGVGAQVRGVLADAGVSTPVTVLGLPPAFVPHGSRDELLQANGLDGDGIARSVADALQSRTPVRSLRRFGSRGDTAPRKDGLARKDGRKLASLQLLRGGSGDASAVSSPGRRKRGPR